MSAQQNTPPKYTIKVSFENQPDIIYNPDGTYKRTIQFSNTPATLDNNSQSRVLFKDVPLNSKHGTYLRIYLPKQEPEDSLSANKLPIVVYYHGGGFVYLSASSTIIHDFCVKMGAHLPTIIVSVDYRLAPEHRLPAGYDDAVEALHWIKTTQEPWLTEFADLSNCFVMGTSAGGNIAYHAGLRAAAEADDFEPLKIKGLVLHHPFFGGLGRTGSELRSIDSPILTLSGTDLMWELSLPIGADRDHEYCNPTVGGGSNQLGQVRVVGWRILVTGCHDDPLIDRQIELARMLEEKGLSIVAHFGEGYHSIELVDESKAKELFGILENFISSPQVDDR